MNIETLYTIVDEFLKIIGNKSSNNSKLNNSEIITIYIKSFESYGGNYSKTIDNMYQGGNISYKISRSRFSRRINKLKNVIVQIFELLSLFAKNTNNTYQIDSYPVKVCHNVRISRCKLLKGEENRGWNQSKKEYVYGIKIHAITSENGYIVEFCYTPASFNDSKVFDILDFNLPEGSELIGDKAYNLYDMEEYLYETSKISLLPIRKVNSKKEDNTISGNYYKQTKRKIIETFFSLIDRLLPKKIHATNLNGFLFKITGFILAFNFSTFLK